MRAHLAAIVLVALLGALPSAAHGQAPSLDGSYLLAADASDDVNRAIESSVARMGFIVRPIARSRLRKTNVPYRRLRISTDDGRISIAPDAAAPVVSPMDGTPIRWRREDGEVLDVVTAWEGGSLSQTFRADDGSRENRYSLSPDGRTLTMQVTVRSPRLPAPLTYVMRYRRAD